MVDNSRISSSITRTIHILPFERLSWLDFERLCFWVVTRSGFENVEHVGAAGSDGGRDLTAVRDSKVWFFQCKRVRRFGPTQAMRALGRILSLPAQERPSVLTFIVTCPVSNKTRAKVRALSEGKIVCHFWSETELDEKVKRDPFIVDEFFEDSRRELKMVGGMASGTTQAQGSNVYLRYLSTGEQSNKLREIRVDFAPYLSQLIESFEQDALSQHYVDLRYSRLDLEMQFDSGMPSVKGSWVETDEVIDKCFESWLSSSSQRQLSILGDFGSGKTSLCKHLAYVLAKRHMADPDSARIPLLISLKSRRQLGTIENTISHFFKQQWGLQVDRSVLPWLAKAGRLCVILDGFDEMVARVDKSRRRESFEMIARLAQYPTKVLVTGRLGYFPELLEMCEIFGRDLGADSYQQLERNLRRYLGTRPEFEILRVNPLSNDQIDKILQSYGDHFVQNEFCTWKEIKALIDEVYDLRDLASRPILLDLIIRTLPQIRRTETSIDIAKIYQLYTNYWCEVEWEKGDVRHLLTSAERHEVMRFLASKMYWSGKSRVPVSEIPSRTFKQRNATAQELEWLEHDIRTCSFLKLSDDSLFEFVHSSFMEYFLANDLFTKISNGALDIFQEVQRPEWNVGKSVPLTDGTMVFLKLMVEAAHNNGLSKILYYKSWTWARHLHGQEILYISSHSHSW